MATLSWDPTVTYSTTYSTSSTNTALGGNTIWSTYDPISNDVIINDGSRIAWGPGFYLKRNETYRVKSFKVYEERKDGAREVELDFGSGSVIKVRFTHEILIAMLDAIDPRCSVDPDDLAELFGTE